MDITGQSPNVLSLCSGYGGFEIGLERVFGKIAVLAYVEIEAFAVANLVNKMETSQMAPAPIWTDVKTFDARSFRGCVDFLTGGYPCQPFSVAGQRKGSDDPRHLWPHIRRIIDECRPGWVFLENVEGHLSKGVTEVLSDLEKMAYRPECGVFSAAEVGAPHQRKRVFILAHNERQGLQIAERCRETFKLTTSERSRVSQWPAGPGEQQHEWEEPRTVADDSSNRRREGRTESTWEQGRSCASWSRIGETQPELGRAVDGDIDRVDRLRLLGNGVVPQTAEKALMTLYNKLYDLLQ